MYSKILAPVDMAHVDKLEKALQTTADLAKMYAAPVAYVGVTSPQPGPAAHTPEEFEQKLEAFAARQTAAHGHASEAHMVVAHDPAADLDHVLIDAVDEVGADLVVMASHVPGVANYVWPTHGGQVAGHAKASVFVVRPE